MPSLSPALGATSTISIPTLSSTGAVRATLEFTALPSPGELSEPVYELWTDLPTSDAPDAATWRAVPFEHHPGAAGEYSLRLASSFQSGKQYEYTLRRLWPDGGLEWFGNGGSNGVVRVIEGTELKAEGIEVLFEDDSGSKIGRPVVQPLDSLQSDLDSAPDAMGLADQPRKQGQGQSQIGHSNKDEPEPELQSEAVEHPTNPFIDPPSLPPSPTPHSATPTEPVPARSSTAASGSPADEDSDSQAHFLALLSAFFASLLAFLCYPLAGGRLTLGSDAGDALSERSERDQEAGDDHESETTDDAMLKTPGDSPVASTQQTPQIKSTGLLVDIEGPSQST